MTPDELEMMHTLLVYAAVAPLHAGTAVCNCVKPDMQAVAALEYSGETVALCPGYDIAVVPRTLETLRP